MKWFELVTGCDGYYTPNRFKTEEAAKSEQKFRALVNAPDGKGGYKQKHLGYFTNPDEAHLAWKIAKFELACNLAAIQVNSQIAEALIKRYTYEI